MRENVQWKNKLEKENTPPSKAGIQSSLKRCGWRSPGGGEILWADLSQSLSTVAGQVLEGRVTGAGTGQQETPHRVVWEAPGVGSSRLEAKL